MTFNYKINNTRYIINNDYKNNRNGFSHSSTLNINGCNVATAKINYINRTWEKYEFQTSARKVINNYIASLIEKYKNTFMDENNFSRLTQKRKLQFKDYLDRKKDIIELKLLLNTLDY